MDISQIENTINEIRKRSNAIMAFNKDEISNAMFHTLAATSEADHGVSNKRISKHNFLKKFENNQRQDHSIGKWYTGENNHQKKHFASRSENFGRFLLNEEKIQNHKSDLESVVFQD